MIKICKNHSCKVFKTDYCIEVGTNRIYAERVIIEPDTCTIYGFIGGEVSAMIDTCHKEIIINHVC